MITVLPLDTAGLGDRSYLAHDGEIALVVDPQRDTDRLLALAAEAGVRITHVFETHVHNDYVTGGLALARSLDAVYVLNADDPVAFESTGVRDGDVLTVGGMQVRVLLTPGHTHTHLSYVLEAGDSPVAVFTGGSLLFGSTGRPDLLGPDHTDRLAHAQWRSAQRLAAELDDSVPVHPTHGFGSFCSATQSSGTASTIGQERQTNTALTSGETTYVADLLAGLDVYPSYYARMAPMNLAGPAAPDLSLPAPVDPAELRRRIAEGEWVVDLRSGTAFAAGHLAGTLNLGLDGPFVTYLGWLLPPGTPLTLLGPTVEDVAEAQLEMVRIGIERPAGMATGTPEQWAGEAAVTGYPIASFADLAAALTGPTPPVVLDVRRAQERGISSIVGSVHLPIHEILGRLDDVPAGTVWVHCGGGYRAAVVASVLHAHGRDVVAIDQSFDQAGPAGLPLSPSAVSPTKAA